MTRWEFFPRMLLCLALLFGGPQLGMAMPGSGSHHQNVVGGESSTRIDGEMAAAAPDAHHPAGMPCHTAAQDRLPESTQCPMSGVCCACSTSAPAMADGFLGAEEMVGHHSPAAPPASYTSRTTSPLYRPPIG